MKGSRSYYEATVPFDGDPLVTATRVAESAGYRDYVLYEYRDEWSLGMGVHARVTVYPGRTVLSADGSERVFENEDLSVTIHTALSHVEVNGWRVYGTADFELARTLYRLEVQDEDKPLAKMFVPEVEVRFGDKSILLRALDWETLDVLKKRLDSILSGSDRDLQERIAAGRKFESPGIETRGAERYKAMVAGALEEIRRHDYRKVILSRRVQADQEIDMAASYVVGRRANTPARSYFLSFDGLEAAGFSPETVVEVNESREVFTTPLAGTRAIGADISEELALREELLSDSKEIAEHAISVYVGFDEMTMMCDPRTVCVTNFMLVSQRGPVQHLASRVKGKLLQSCNSWHAFNALFPAVTASGVPKLPSVDAIGRHEPHARGLYSGCVMICDQSGALDGALVLRSFFRQGGQTWMQAGAGVMNMSTPEREREETGEKLRSCYQHLVLAG